MSERTRFITGLVIATVGVIILGSDRLVAKADSNTFLGQSTSIFTIVGLVVLFIATVWFIAFRPRKKE